jgi:hypothetical protein
MNTASIYQLNPFSGIVQHGPFGVSIVQDRTQDAWWEQEYQLRIATQVRSGDYFETLATRLDDLSQSVGQYDDGVAAELEQIVKDLLYLQRLYIIDKKS